MAVPVYSQYFVSAIMHTFDSGAVPCGALGQQVIVSEIDIANPGWNYNDDITFGTEVEGPSVNFWSPGPAGLSGYGNSNGNGVFQWKGRIIGPGPLSINIQVIQGEWCVNISGYTLTLP